MNFEDKCTLLLSFCIEIMFFILIVMFYLAGCMKNKTYVLCILLSFIQKLRGSLVVNFLKTSVEIGYIVETDHICNLRNIIIIGGQ
jgi:hypothetical protein